MFSKRILNFPVNLFPVLLASNEWEQLGAGNHGAILYTPPELGTVPIVRSTTAYTKPSQLFSAVHNDIIANIRNAFLLSDLEFNNAMVEVYAANNVKMKFHSDQSLDLADSSYICLVSFYENDKEENVRKLIFKNKSNSKDDSDDSDNKREITMDHNSAILFSTEANEHHVHQIVGTKKPGTGRWLGLTLRLSKTMIAFRPGPRDGEKESYFVTSGATLKLASRDERLEFYQHKSRENAQIAYGYPNLCYTLSRH